MSKNLTDKYYPGFKTILILLLALSGISFGMDCCEDAKATEENHSCCCSVVVEEPAGCETGNMDLDRINMPDDCPCILSAPVTRPEAVAITVLNNLDFPTSTIEYELQKSGEIHFNDFSFSLHLQHSTKTYKFTEAYLN